MKQQDNKLKITVGCSKAEVIRRLRAKRPFLISLTKGYDSHKYEGKIRRADWQQTNAIRFEGGSWLYFNEIDKNSCFLIKYIESGAEMVTFRSGVSDCFVRYVEVTDKEYNQR